MPGDPTLYVVNDTSDLLERSKIISMNQPAMLSGELQRSQRQLNMSTSSLDHRGAFTARLSIVIRLIASSAPGNSVPQSPWCFWTDCWWRPRSCTLHFIFSCSFLAFQTFSRNQTTWLALDNIRVVIRLRRLFRCTQSKGVEAANLLWSTSSFILLFIHRAWNRKFDQSYGSIYSAISHGMRAPLN